MFPTLDLLLPVTSGFLRNPNVTPSTQTTIGSLFGMVPTGLEPLTRLLSLVRYLRVVSWSIGKAGGGSHDGLHGHRVKVVLSICLGTKHVQRVRVLVCARVLPYTK